MYYGHLGHFHRDIFHLNWYKIVCMGNVACTFNQMKFINMPSMYLQPGGPKHFLLRFIAVWTSLFSCLCMSIFQCWPRTPAQYAKTWVFWDVLRCVRQRKYIWSFSYSMSACALGASYSTWIQSRNVYHLIAGIGVIFHILLHQTMYWKTINTFIN